MIDKISVIFFTTLCLLTVSVSGTVRANECVDMPRDIYNEMRHEKNVCLSYGRVENLNSFGVCLELHEGVCDYSELFKARTVSYPSKCFSRMNLNKVKFCEEL